MSNLRFTNNMLKLDSAESTAEYFMRQHPKQ